LRSLVSFFLHDPEYGYEYPSPALGRQIWETDYLATLRRKCSDPNLIYGVVTSFNK
jgi:hypothetical protein